MLQFDLRVTVRDPNTRKPLEDYTEDDATVIQALIEGALDEWIVTLGGRKVLVTISSGSVVK